MEETAEKQNIALLAIIAAGGKLQAQLAASEAARGRLRDALEFLDESLRKWIIECQRLKAQLAAMTAERDDLRRTNDALAEIIGGEETAKTQNYEIVDVAELQAQLAASEAARGRLRDALEELIKWPNRSYSPNCAKAIDRAIEALAAEPNLEEK